MKSRFVDWYLRERPPGGLTVMQPSTGKDWKTQRARRVRMETCRSRGLNPGREDASRNGGRVRTFSQE
jgi:hypothetical protein